MSIDSVGHAAKFNHVQSPVHWGGLRPLQIDLMSKLLIAKGRSEKNDGAVHEGPFVSKERERERDDCEFNKLIVCLLCVFSLLFT